MPFIQGKILVADDDESIVELIMLYLRKDGFDVITARDGGEALRKITQHSPDLVLRYHDAERRLRCREIGSATGR